MRVLSRFQELNAIFVAIVRSLPGLWVICLLAFFYFTIFGIVCLELFKGLLSYRCMSPDFTNAYLDEDNVTLLNVSYNSLPLDTSQQAAQVCKGPKAENITWSNSSGLPATGPFPNSGVQSWGFSCPWVPTDNPWAYWYPYGGYGPNDPSGNNYASGLTCASWGNPDIGGFRNFDNILFTWIQLFQHTLMQDWSFVMFNTQGAVSYWTWVLHIGMVIIGGFILVNLTVAVVFLNFSRHYSKPEDDYENEDEEVLIESKLEVKDGKLASTARTEDLLLHAEGNDDGTVSQGRTSLLKRLRGRGIWKATRRIAFAIQASKYFERLTTLVIVLNSIAMACVWYGQPQKSLQVQEIANYVFTGYFVVEMLIKHLGLGIKAYWKDGFNVFDGIVTIIGVIEVIVTLVGSANSTALMIFRMLRLLRIFRLARNWTSLQRIITVLINSLMSSFWIIVLLVFYMFSFGLLGQTFFGYKLDVCSVGNQVCPNGISLSDCPDHLNCYVDCSELEFGTWIDVNGSPYNNQAYCEAFGSNITYSLVNGTRTYTFGNDTQFIAQVGLPSITNPNYDSLYNAFLAMFVILTQDSESSSALDCMTSALTFVSCSEQIMIPI